MIEYSHKQQQNWKNYVKQLFSGTGQQKELDIIVEKREMNEVSYTFTVIFSWESSFQNEVEAS